MNVPGVCVVKLVNENSVEAVSCKDYNIGFWLLYNKQWSAKL